MGCTCTRLMPSAAIAGRFASSAFGIVRGSPSWRTSISSTGSTPARANAAPVAARSARRYAPIAPGSSLRICTTSKPCPAANSISCSGGRQLSGKNRPTMPMRTGSGGGARAAQDELRDLDRVQRGALAEVVAREEQREAALHRRVASNPADQHLFLAGGLPRRGEVLDPDRRGRAEQLACTVGRKVVLEL